MIGERTAELIKIEISSAFADGAEKTMKITGRELSIGLSKMLIITSSEIREELREPVNAIIDAISQHWNRHLRNLQQI